VCFTYRSVLFLFMPCHYITSTLSHFVTKRKFFSIFYSMIRRVTFSLHYYRRTQRWTLNLWDNFVKAIFSLFSISTIISSRYFFLILCALRTLHGYSRVENRKWSLCVQRSTVRRVSIQYIARYSFTYIY